MAAPRSIEQPPTSSLFDEGFFPPKLKYLTSLKIVEALLETDDPVVTLQGLELPKTLEKIVYALLRYFDGCVCGGCVARHLHLVNQADSPKHWRDLVLPLVVRECMLAGVVESTELELFGRAQDKIPNGFLHR